MHDSGENLKQPTLKPRKRLPGRPVSSGAGAQATDLRGRLLDAAIACFVRKGIDGTSLRDIATEASVTPALLHYYFGDKMQLQQAVIEERVMPVFAALREPLMRIGDDTAALVAGFVTGIGRIVAEHPWLPPLWVREVLCEGGALREVLFNQIGPQLPQMMASRFAEAQAARRDQPGSRSAVADGLADWPYVVSGCRCADLAALVRRRRPRRRRVARPHHRAPGPRHRSGLREHP